MISACLIVKNEEKNLKHCLESLAKVTDEIILVDTGSEDLTISIAEKFGCRIFHYIWNNNFSDTRNFALSKATGEFIISIDADEELINGNELKNLFADIKSTTAGFLVDVISVAKDTSGILRKYKSSQIRLFRNHPQIRYNGIVHEQIIDSILKLNLNIQKSNIQILHSGYNISADELKLKNQRNLLLLNSELSVNFSIYNLINKARTLFALENFKEAKLILNAIIEGKYNGTDNYTKIKCLNLLGEIYLKSDDIDAAANCFSNSLILNPVQIFPIYKLTDIAFIKKDLVTSLQFLKSLEILINNKQDFSDDFIIDYQEIIFKVAKLLLIKNQFNEALLYLSEKESLFKENPEILYLYGNALFKNNLYVESLQMLEKTQRFGLKSHELDSAIQKIKKLISTKNQILLSLCMIVKNEEKYLEDCLESARNIADEMIIVDTGSTDMTKKIAEKFHAKIYDFKWINDFSAARNESVKNAKGKWILYLDADERIIVNNTASFRNMLENTDEEIGAVNCIVESEVRKNDGSLEIQRGIYPRLFRNYGFPEIKFEGKVHEQISQSLLRLNKSVMNSDITIIHLGYNASDENISEKAERNYTLLIENLNENPDDAYTRFQLGQTLAKLNRFSEAENFLTKSVDSGKLSDSVLSSAYNLLAQLNGYRQDYETALDFAEKSLQSAKNQELGLLIKSEALIKLYKYSEAKDTLENLMLLKKNKSLISDTGFDINFPESKIKNILKYLSEKTKNQI